MLKEQVPRRKSSAIGCLKITGIGCLVIFFLLIALGVLLIVNRDSIRESSWFRDASNGFESARVEMESLMEMNDLLRERYPADEVNIARSSRSGDEGPTLRLIFENAEFDTSGEREKAKEIAAFVEQQFPQSSYAEIEVAFTGDGESGSRADRSWTFDRQELMLVPAGDAITPETASDEETSVESSETERQKSEDEQRSESEQ